ncbi:ammonium transporter [Pseudonocardia sp. KRD-184]|uniref:Ammonium transporter n=1 Tax=Pseudonocardia oceani TaxID=2792013 RepID=A0ABS6UDU4_9PSEU|nr:ammonium transporter [Pseudonocardia oceani]MBW0098874.1 ammonium transporter [Pseudonocardia oceani]MBW0111393.1 ammonium transporter [Pseudonocardia oceani]MBW0125155.1 ammonium transporter [Pseudonocardia oceani]MBW0130397.1 ammonium transporter [Pseudonocardia oceani]
MQVGNTAYVLGCAALVMLMTPGLAFFYGGMVRAKSVLNMMMMSVVCLGVVGLVWVLGGFSLAFGDSTGGLIGNLDLAGLRDTTTVVGGDAGIPLQVFAMFQLMFAVITAALLSGAVADRARFWPFALFIALWTVLVYVPLAHWIFAFDGFVGESGGWMANTLGALDFAGGTAVEINSGASALALALVLGRRRGWPQQPMRPHNLPAVLLGAGLLWFGWFGFNAGSALAAGAVAGNAFVTTMTASAAAVLSWLALEHRLDGRPTSLGAASAAVAGLVGITPACGYVDTFGALAIGLLAGVVCQLAIRLKYRLGYDDSLDVVAIHGVGGLLGMLMLGFVATNAVNDAGADGLLYGGGPAQLGKQVVAVLATAAFAFGVSFLLAWLIRATIGFRVDAEIEAEGIDEAEHAETAYDYTPLTTTGRSLGAARTEETTG